MSKKKTVYIQTYVRMPEKMQKKLLALTDEEQRVSLNNTIVSVIGRWFQAQKPHQN